MEVKPVARDKGKPDDSESAKDPYADVRGGKNDPAREQDTDSQGRRDETTSDKRDPSGGRMI